MTEAQIKSVACFFFFAFLNESLALQATVRTVKHISKRFKKSPELSESDQNAIIVFQTAKAWEKYSRQHNRKFQGPHFEAGWQLPEDTDLAPWRQFLKEVGSEEVLAVIWSRILCFSDECMAKGLGLTVGTVRYRVGRGLRKLGSFYQMGTSHG